MLGFLNLKAKTFTDKTQAIQEIPKAKINLEEAINISLERSPRLKAAEAQLAIGKANVITAKSRINPNLVSDNGLAEKTYRLGIEKTLELGSKRSKRIELAENNKKQIESEVSLLKLNLRTEVRQTYTALYVLQEKYKCFQNIIESTEKLLDIAVKREKSGATANLDTLQVEMVNLKAKNELENIGSQLIQAQNKLNAFFNQDLRTVLELENPNKLSIINTEAAQIGVTEQSPFTAAPIDDGIDTLINTALTKRPEMKINLNKQTGSVTELELAKANRIPNLSITLGPDLVLNNSGNNSTGIFIIGNMQLPLLYQGQGQIQAAKAKNTQFAKEKEDLINQISLEVSNAYNMLNANNAKLKRFETELNPKADIINEKSLRCFEEGKCPVFIPISAKQSLIDTRINYLNAIADYQNSISDLERALGDNHEK
ncbi:MAG: TolC family protein [Cyanobacteria bacterium REEB446]|nr:TolC family protein [Cyanobacteria bacterium REEB446]